VLRASANKRKGKLSTEELMQLAERVPIIFSTAAESMGVGTQELYKLIETGTIQSVDFAPEVVSQWREYVRDTGMLEAAINTSRVAMSRFGTTFKENVLDAFDAGADGGLASFFNNMTALLEDAAPTFRVIGKVFGEVVDAVGWILRALYQIARPFTMIFDQLLNSSVDQMDEGSKRLAQGLETFYGVAKKIAGVLLYPFGVLERLLNSQEFSAIGALIGGTAGFLSPIPGGMAAGAALGGLGAGYLSSGGDQRPQTVNINVSADTKDLGVKIADEVNTIFSASMRGGYL